MHLAIDADDVIVDFCGRVIETVNMEYDAQLTLADVKSWNLNLLLDPILGEDWWLWWEERDWLWAKASAIPGAIGGLRRLHQQGHIIDIVTAKPDWARAGFSQWLGKWQPYYDRVIVGPARPPMVKSEWTDARLLVDDKPDNVLDFFNKGRQAILYDRPHNWDFDHKEAGIPRAYNWAEVLHIIEYFNQGGHSDSSRADGLRAAR
jgi:5'(3')-deoxyribonucleotidase